MLNLKIDGREVQAEKGTLLSDLADRYGDKENDILIAIVGNRLTELFEPVTDDCEIRFLTGRDKDGMLAYRRSLIFLMQKALDDLVKKGEFGADKSNKG
jgi:uridine kinase